MEKLFKKNIHYQQGIEEAILGACLIEKFAIGRTYGLLEPEYFYYDAHQKIYNVMRGMYDKSIPIDIYTVIATVSQKENADGFFNFNVDAFIPNLTNRVVNSTHLEGHCLFLKEMWQRRRIIEIKSKHRDDLDSESNIAAMHAELSDVMGRGGLTHWEDMPSIMVKLIQHQVDIAAGKKTFLTSGIKRVDDTNGGFSPGQLIVIGARPGVGKSALMGQMALGMAKAKRKVGIVSLEMNNTEIAARLSSIESNFSFKSVYQTIAYDEEQHKKFYSEVRHMANYEIFISDKTKVNVNEIKAKASQLKALKGCDCIFVDYLQLVDSHTGEKNYSREQEVAKMSRGLKLMAMELEIPVIVLCQLNRESVNRAYKDRFPRLSDLRESGAIEQDADIVLFLHRDWVAGYPSDDDNNSTEYSADLICRKWRNGAMFSIKLGFEPIKMKFTESTIIGSPFQDTSHYQDDNPF